MLPSDPHIWKYFIYMMTSPNRNIFRVTGALWGNPPVNGGFLHKGQWRGALMFSLIYTWTNSGANNRDVVYLRRHRAHCILWGHCNEGRLMEKWNLFDIISSIIEHSIGVNRLRYINCVAVVPRFFVMIFYETIMIIYMAMGIINIIGPDMVTLEAIMGITILAPSHSLKTLQII